MAPMRLCTLVAFLAYAVVVSGLPASTKHRLLLESGANSSDPNTKPLSTFTKTLSTFGNISATSTSNGTDTALATARRLHQYSPCVWFDNNGASVTPAGDTSTCAKCQAACAPHPRCYTYTWNGGRRANYNDASVCSSAPQLSCPDIAGYTKYVGQDHTGDDINNACISGTDFSAAAAACNSNPSCRAFNMLAGRGFYCVKSAASPLTPLADACFYTKNAPPPSLSCPDIAGYTKYVGQDHTGDDINNACISGTNFNTAAAACNSNPSCRAFNMLAGRGFYCVKSAASPLTPLADACFYTKNAPPPSVSCPDIAGYTKYVGQDHGGNDINNACISGTNFNTAAAACNSNPSCRAFNMLAGRGFYCLKSVASPIAPLSDACFYTKNAQSGGNTAGGDWRSQMLALVNQVRAQAGAPPVCYNAKLNTASQQQSDSGRYGHTWNYVNAVGYQWNSLGQNIAQGQTSVQQVFSAWYNESPPNDGHRLNILNRDFTQMGVGWTQGTNMWTQNFGRSSSEPCS